MEHFMELVMKKFLGPKAATFGIWSLKTSLGHLSQKTYFQTGPHFLQNHNMNLIKSWSFKLYYNLGVWGQKLHLNH